jgi:hypothetical protein
MKDFYALLIFFFALLFLTFSLFVADIATKAYNTQKDREMFLKSYEIVMECRKSYGVNIISATKMCGEVPLFVSQVP